MKFALINLIIFPLFIAGVVALQIFLSRREAKWPGLALPVLSLCISLLAVLSIAAFSVARTGPVVDVTVSEDGQIIEQVYEPAPQQQASVAGSFEIGAIIIVFLLYNIPTVILLVIYAACREKFKKKNELEKMNIQDLS